MEIRPPPAGGQDKLRTVRVPAGTAWYRIVHRRHPSALHFSLGTEARWNDPLGSYGVLYLADTPETAFAETFGHDIPDTHTPGADKFVTALELEERRLHLVRTDRELCLGLLQGAGLAALNLDTRLLATIDYAGPQAWSRWIYEAPGALDGIRWQSRLLSDRESTALFERCRGALQEEDLGPLSRWRCAATGRTVADILDEQGWGLI